MVKSSLVVCRPPHMTRRYIGQRVADMLKALFGGNGWDDRYPAPMKRIAELLETRHSVDLDFGNDLGHEGGNKIYGRFRVRPFRIEVDRSLPRWDPKFRFCLSHEIGHLVLHRKMMGAGMAISTHASPADTATRLRYKEMAELSDLDWIEWQANEFAVSLMLPQRFLLWKVVHAQQKLGIVRNLGTIRLDGQPGSMLDMKKIIAAIGLETRIPTGLLLRRLRYLGIIDDQRQSWQQSSVRELTYLFHTGNG
jgi:hypothetical protein